MLKGYSDTPLSYSVSGNLKGEKKEKTSLIHRIGLNFDLKLFEPKSKKYAIVVGGNVQHNYDVFGKSFHLNGFGHIGIEF